MKNRDLARSAAAALLGAVAGGFIAAYQMSILSDELVAQVVKQLGSANLMIPIGAAQSAILTFVCTFFGLKLARRVNLKINVIFDKQGALLATVLAVAAALLITASDMFIFASYLPESVTTYTFSPLYLVSAVLYGGIIEEILLRLFLMSLFVWLLWKVFEREQDGSKISAWIYHVAIYLAAALFALGHYPTTAQLLGTSAPILIRMFLLNGAAGIGFGYLYWKKGLTYAITAHMLTHIFMQLVFMPLFS